MTKKALRQLSKNADAIVASHLTRLALGTLVRGADGALSAAIPVPLAQILCARLRADGFEADWSSPDHDDTDLAWVYIRAGA